MLNKKILLAAVFAASCATGSAFAADEKAVTEAAIQAAIAAQKAAAAVGGEWRDTGKVIKQAQAAAAEGNFGNAQQLAKKAEDQGKIGKAQALGEVGVGNPGYLYN